MHAGQLRYHVSHFRPWLFHFSFLIRGDAPAAECWWTHSAAGGSHSVYSRRDGKRISCITSWPPTRLILLRCCSSACRFFCIGAADWIEADIHVVGMHVKWIICGPNKMGTFLNQSRYCSLACRFLGLEAYIHVVWMQDWRTNVLIPTLMSFILKFFGKC